jgi:hypothetical protein
MRAAISTIHRLRTVARPAPVAAISLSAVSFVQRGQHSHAIVVLAVEYNNVYRIALM